MYLLTIYLYLSSRIPITIIYFHKKNYYKNSKSFLSNLNIYHLPSSIPIIIVYISKKKLYIYKIYELINNNFNIHSGNKYFIYKYSKSRNSYYIFSFLISKICIKNINFL